MRIRTISAAEASAWLLGLGVALAPLAIWGGREGGLDFVLYRAPKEVAVQVVSWLVILLAVVSLPRPLAACLRAAARPPLLLLLAYVGWNAASGAWASAPPLWRGHLPAWITTALAAVALAALFAGLAAEASARLRQTLQIGLCSGAAALTLLGALQALGLLPGLALIDPEIARAFPATMGWKNPTAHLIAWQLFLLAELAWRQKTRARRWLLLAGLGLEVIYLVSLQSRSALFAVSAGALALLLALPPGELRRRAGGGLMVAALAAALALAAAPAARERARSLLELATRPAAFLATDRGQYLRSTWGMVAAHPFGVGLGCWQSEYPVHRVSSFGADREFEARQAHSDWVQALGEGGYPGFLLWAGFWIVLLREAARTARAGNERLTGALLLAQLVAAMGCGLTDYVTEMPLFRLQLALLVALAAAEAPAGSAPVPRDARWRRLVVVAIALGGLLYSAWAAGTLVAADSEARLEALSRQPPVERERALELAERLRRLPKASGTEHRAFHFAAALALENGELERGRLYLELARQRSPWDPFGFELRARLAEKTGDSALAARLRSCGAQVAAPAVAGHPAECESLPGLTGRRQP